MKELLKKTPLPRETLKTISPDNSFVKTLAETVLGNPDILSGLNLDIGDGDKDTILERIVFQLEANLENQKPFINSLFEELAIEGKWNQTNKRDGAFTILTDQAMTPIIEANASFVANAYLEAISLQTYKNDPFSGSIDVLLETGKEIIPYLSLDPDLKKQIVKAWRKIINKLPLVDEKDQIESGLKKLKYVMSSRWARDNRVEELKNKGLKNPEIAKELGYSVGTVNNSVRSLKDQRRIVEENGSSERIIERDNRVEELRNKGLKNPEIAKELGCPKSQVNNSIQRLLKQGRIKV